MADTSTLDLAQPSSGDSSPLAAFLAAVAEQPVVRAESDVATLHVGIDDLPWVPVGDGSFIQLLHVDLAQNLWITKTRLPAAHRIAKHYHTGSVLAVTLTGRWYYLEAPDAVNAPGSYLFEPAGSVHTLATPDDQTGETLVWFAIHGANLTLGEDGAITKVIDARFVLDLYRGFCDATGQSHAKLIVVG